MEPGGSIWIAASLASALFFLLPGYQIAAGLRRDDSFVHLISLAMLLSSGINSLTLYILGLASAISLQNLLYVWVLINLLAAFAFRSHVIMTIPRKLKPGLSLGNALAPLTILIWILVFLNSATWPFSAWDSLLTFNTAAIHVLQTGSTDHFLLPGYRPDLKVWYPLGLSMSYIWPYLVTGFRAENVAHSISPFFVLMMLGYSYLLARQLGGSGKLAAFLVAVYPPVTVYTFYGYADVASAAFFAAAAFYAVRWVEGQSRADLAISGMSAGLTAWMKPQGFFVVAALPIVLLLIGLLRRGAVSPFRSRHLLLLPVAMLPFLLYYVYTAATFGPSMILGTATSYTGANVSAASQYEMLAQRTVVAVQRLLVGSPEPSVPARSGWHILPLSILAIFGTFYPLVRRNMKALVPSLLALGYIIVWIYALGWRNDSDRWLIPYFGLALTLSTPMLIDLLRRSGHQRRILYGAMLLVVIAPAAATSANLAFRGFGPALDWSLNNLNTPAEVKSNYLFGPMWRIANFAQSHSEIADSEILITDSRMLSWIYNATFRSWPPSEDTLCHYDYAIVRVNRASSLSSHLILFHFEQDWGIYKVVGCTQS